ncbi:solute carrier family 23 member 3-like isoform X3 [Cyrtonyx montezumae]|uniref:solute carrier family 23 member 3-like isoform X3 n=1 Tax=Cyrtonyx montezumae TaxID=9017 RepID=UPI0032DA0577
MGGGSSMNGGHHPVTGAGSPALTSCSWMKMCSWMLSCCLALQHLAVQASLLCVFHLLLLPAVSEEQLHTPSVSVLLARSFFACGISTLLQTSLGSRMPLVQILSFEYLVPALVLSSHLHLGSSADGNGMAVATVCPEPHCTVTESRAALFREVGAPPVLLLLSVPHSPCRISATTLQGIAVSRWGTRRCAEVVGMLVHVAFPGLGASRAGLEHGTGDHLEVSGGDWDAVFSILSPTGLWGRAGLWAHPVGAGSSGCVRLGGAALWAHGPGPQHLYHRAVCLQGGCFLLLCQLGGSTAAHAPHHHLLPAPGVLPSALLCLALCPRSLCGAVRPHLTHSLGSPPLCCCLHGLLYPQPPPPLLGLARPGNSTAFLGQQHPSRTVAPDALCRWGCRAGCSHHPLATSPVPSPLLQDGSRLSVQLNALACVMLGMSPRLVGLFAHIPLAVHGGVLCVTYAVAVGTGISYFQYADIDSGRNIFIVGFTMFMALLVPRWLSVAPARLVTGWVPLDLLFLSLLMMPVFLTGFLSFFLENTVSGTLEERGLLAEQVQQKPETSTGQSRRERGKASPVYGLPTRLRRLLPSSCKTFPCCFLCPGSEDEKEEEEEEDGGRVAEEGMAAAAEGTHLLLKPGTEETEEDGRPSQAEMFAWRTGA